MLSFFRTNVESIDQVQSNLSEIFPNAASLPQSSKNSEQLLKKHQCARTEELLRTFSIGHHSRQSSEGR